MVSLSVDVASSASKANQQARAGKSDRTSAGDDFGALVDSNAADAATVALADSSPSRNQTVPRNEGASNTGDRRDRSPNKTAEASDNANEPVAAPADLTAATDVAAEMPVVSITLESAASIAADLLPVEKLAVAVDASSEADSSAQTDQLPIQPVVTGIVAPVAALPVVAAAVAIDAAPVAPADSLTIDLVSTATIETPEAPAHSTPSIPAVRAPEQTAEPAAIAGVAIAQAAKPKPAVAAQVDVETETSADGVTPLLESKPQVTAELPSTDAKPAAKPDAIDKPAAKVEPSSPERPAKADTAATAPEVRTTSHQANVEARFESPGTPAIATTVTAPAQHIPTAHASAAVQAPINASVQLASDVAVPITSLGVNIAFNANAGRSRFEIRLDPAELGRIDVRLDIDKNGQITSHLTVERPATLDMLRRDAPQLQRALEDAGLQTSDSGLQFSLRDQSQQQTSADDRSSGGQSYRLSIDELPAASAEAGRTYARLAAARGGVDIRI